MADMNQQEKDNSGENTQSNTTEVTRMENTSNSTGNGKRLYKSRNKMICGVCGGIAEYFNIDPTIIRLIVVFLSLAGVGSGLLAYIIAAIVMPDAPQEQ